MMAQGLFNIETEEDFLQAWRATYGIEDMNERAALVEKILEKAPLFAFSPEQEGELGLIFHIVPLLQAAEKNPRHIQDCINLAERLATLELPPKKLQKFFTALDILTHDLSLEKKIDEFEELLSTGEKRGGQKLLNDKLETIIRPGKLAALCEGLSEDEAAAIAISCEGLSSEQIEAITPIIHTDTIEDKLWWISALCSATFSTDQEEIDAVMELALHKKETAQILARSVFLETPWHLKDRKLFSTLNQIPSEHWEKTLQTAALLDKDLHGNALVIAFHLLPLLEKAKQEEKPQILELAKDWPKLTHEQIRQAFSIMEQSPDAPLVLFQMLTRFVVQKTHVLQALGDITKLLPLLQGLSVEEQATVLLTFDREHLTMLDSKPLWENLSSGKERLDVIAASRMLPAHLISAIAEDVANHFPRIKDRVVFLATLHEISSFEDEEEILAFRDVFPKDWTVFESKLQNSFIALTDKKTRGLFKVLKKLPSDRWHLLQQLITFIHPDVTKIHDLIACFADMSLDQQKEFIATMELFYKKILPRKRFSRIGNNNSSLKSLGKIYRNICKNNATNE
jgi:hypothetical protein